MKELISNPKRLAAWNFWLWVAYGVFVGFVYLPIVGCAELVGLENIVWSGFVSLVGLLLALLIIGVAHMGLKLRRPTKVILVVMAIIGCYLYIKSTSQIARFLNGYMFGSCSHLEAGHQLREILSKVFAYLWYSLPGISFTSIMVSGEFKTEASPKA